MNNDISSGRPAKRVRQACEPCRRKKAKCPGEQPVCSLCARLRQECVYARERRNTPSERPPPVAETASTEISQETRLPRVLEDRLGGLETKMEEILEAVSRRNNEDDERRMIADSLLPTMLSGPVASTTPTSLTPLPPWEKVLAIGELYLLYCESQPLPLFHRETFLRSLQDRELEVIYAMLALSIRFSEESYRDTDDLANRSNSYAETARNLVMRRISEGPVELSTLQCLCLLSLVDFTNGNTHRSSIHGSLAMNLAQCANLGSETRAVMTPVALEERRRCFWSICLLKRLHGEDYNLAYFPDVEYPPFPESPSRPPRSSLPEGMANETRSTGAHDLGILGYVILLSEVFAKTARYVRFHGKPSNIPPWSSESEYSKIIALQMDHETRMPYTHRFKPANLGDRTLEELQANRQYWGPWFLNQFLYHTILCLLNHPLLLSLSLRNFRNTIPEIFLQHTSDLISSHTTWIVHFIDYFEEKSFPVSDPLLGYSAAVVATIELQLSFTEDPKIREEKRGRFSKCVKFVRAMGTKWPHMARLSDRLQRLEGAVSATYQRDPQTRNKSLLIDLSRFWEILEYSSNSDADSARRLFGDSLYTGPPTLAAEISQTSPLPEPSRLSLQQDQSQSASQDYGLSSSLSAGPGPESIIPRSPLDLSGDEFSILAANFFSQGQEFLRGCNNLESFGNF